VFQIAVTPALAFVLVASDGLWNVMSTEDVMGAAWKALYLDGKNVKETCMMLCERADTLQSKHMRYQDDVAAAIVVFESSA